MSFYRKKLSVGALAQLNRAHSADCVVVFFANLQNQGEGIAETVVRNDVMVVICVNNGITTILTRHGIRRVLSMFIDVISYGDYV